MTSRSFVETCLQCHYLRFQLPATANLIFEDRGSILLLRRASTGFYDGWYSVPAGHLDGGETVLQAARREAHEEIGVDVDLIDLSLVHVLHRRKENGQEYVDFFIRVRAWRGSPMNIEQDKSSELSWFSLDALPDNIVPHIRAALEHVVRKEVFFSDSGWDVLETPTSVS